LNEHEVDYVIVGAWARAFHGIPRSTGDIGVPAIFLSLRLFKRNKQAAGRAKDLADLDALPE
jgi:hypothetical protein